jgi:hypothetical protein
MTAPTKLTSATTTVEIDDVDLHTYGMIVNSVVNPPPSAVSASAQIPLRDGDYDFTKSQGVRTMTISGSIIGNNQSNFSANIDGLLSFFRVRDDGRSFKVEFLNQTDRYWTCRYHSFTVKPNGQWMYGHTATFTLVLKCVKPYAEKTTLTTISEMLNTVNPRLISYAGSCPTPIVVSLKSLHLENLLDKSAGGDADEAITGWVGNNCTVSAGATYGLLIAGAYSIIATQTAGGAFYIEVDVTSNIALTKNYVFQAHIKGVSGYTATFKLQIIQNGAGGNKEATADAAANDFANLQVKIQASDLTGATSIKFRLISTGEQNVFYADLMSIFEITATQYADATFQSAPATSDAAGDHIIDSINPNIILHNNTNLFAEGNCDTVTEWCDHTGPYTATTKVVVVDDPFEPGRKCLLYQNPSAGAETIVSGPIPIKKGKFVTVSLEYHCEIQSLGSGLYIIATLYPEQYSVMVAGSEFDIKGIATVSAITSAWTAANAQLSNVGGWPFVRIQINCGASINAKLYIRKIMVTARDTADAVYPAFVKPQYRTLTWTGTIEQNDDVRVDSDKFASQKADFSARTAANTIANISGEPLILLPGTNHLIYRDKRQSYWYSGYPDIQAPGAANAVISYRERYW